MSNYDFKELINNGFDFIKIPNDLFYDGKEGGNFMELGNYNLLIVVTYLKTRYNMLNEVAFSIEKLVRFCGLKVNLNKNESVDKMRNILKFLIDKEYITLLEDDVDIDKVKVKDFINVKINKELKDNFTKIPLSVIDKILNSGYRYSNKILTYWCYLHCRVYKKVNSSDNKANVTWVSLDKISLDIGLSKETIIAYNEILVDLGLLKIENVGIKKKGKTRERCSNIYLTIDGSIDANTLDVYMKEGVSQYKYYIKEQGWEVVDNKKDDTLEQKLSLF